MNGTSEEPVYAIEGENEIIYNSGTWSIPSFGVGISHESVVGEFLFGIRIVASYGVAVGILESRSDWSDVRTDFEVAYIAPAFYSGYKLTNLHHSKLEHCLDI